DLGPALRGSALHPTPDAQAERSGMKSIAKAGLGVIGVLALIAMQASPAHAHPQAQGTDVVGVGSDTAQYGVNFLIEGVNGNAGITSRSLHRPAYPLHGSRDGPRRGTTRAPGGVPGARTHRD